MKFIHPWILTIIIPVLAIGIAGFLATNRRRKRLLREILGIRTNDREACSLSEAKRVWKFILLTLGMILLTVAAARPYIKSSELPVEKYSRDVLAVFDVSKSMRSGDLPPSRMEHAKYLLREVIREFPEDRFGLIPFAGNAYLSCPLTMDHHALLAAVDDLNYSSVPLGGTDLGKALETADKAFRGSAGNHRMILLFTDGDQLSGDAAAAVTGLEKQNIPVVAVGFGSPEIAVPVPGDNGGVMHSASGEIAGSKLNEALLKQLAADTRGIYIRSTTGNTGISAIKNFFDQRGMGNISVENRYVPDDIFPWFILAAAVLLTLSGILSECRKGLFMITIIFCGTMIYAGEPLEIYRKALEMQRSGNATSAELYEQLSAMPQTPEILRSRSLHNLAVMAHMQGREKVDRGKDDLAAQNPDAALKKLEEAEADFRKSNDLYSGALSFAEKKDSDRQRTGNFQHLLLDSENAAKLRKQIEELKQQQQQAQKKTQQAQEQNKQNQSEQDQTQNNNAVQQSKEAQQAAEKLAEQAEKLGQKELAEKAEKAAEKLQEAAQKQKEQKFDEAQKNLEEAAQQLAGKTDQQEKNADNAGEKREEKNIPETPSDPEKQHNSNAQRAIDMLNEETNQLRDAIRKQREVRRMPVQKDW